MLVITKAGLQTYFTSNLPSLEGENWSFISKIEKT